MKMPVFVFFVAISFPFSGYCKVYKCELPPGKFIYQAEPCNEDAQNHGVVNIEEMPLEEREAAKARLQSWQNQQAAENAAKAEAEKQRLEELQKQESLELQRRNVEAQERQAISAEQQNKILKTPMPLHIRHY